MNSFSNDHRFATFVDLLTYRAEHQPDKLAFTFLHEDTTSGVSLTNGQLDERARAIAAFLQNHGTVGDRALLLYPPGLDFITAFFGCLYAGLIPVPAYPPRRNQKVQRLQALLTDAAPRLVLTTSAFTGGISAHFAGSPEFEALQLVPTDQLETGLASSWKRPSLKENMLAFLQYTSGSTSTPKGVMVSHANLIHNSECIRSAFALTPEDRAVTWLPSFHDMGLIDGILQPLYTGFPAVLMSPASFLQQPIRWLKAISHYRATHSGGPNFAYELCVRRTTEEQREGLELSCWKMAYNGAEPVRRPTLELFASTFAPYGFQPRFFYPCYGLAEATLMVTGGLVEEAPVFLTLDSQRLEEHQVETAASVTPKSTSLVGSGRTHLDTKVIIAHPGTRTRCAPDQVGEIWVSGRGIAQGYWNRPKETQEVFHASLSDTGEGPFLRTGDLGFVRGNELFVTGRQKDLLIIRGRNHYPQDIELTAARSHPALHPGGGAAFSVVVNDAEQLVVVHELERVALRSVNVEDVSTAMRRAIAEQHELQTHAVVLLKPGQIPKTSSGKIQRAACRERFLKGTLEPVGTSVLEAEADAVEETARLAPEEILALPPAERPPRLVEHLRWLVSQALRVPVARVDPEHTLLQLGLDSLAATELQHRLEAEFGVAISLEVFLEDNSIARLTEHLLERLASKSAITTQRRPAPSDSGAGHPLSHGQQALWFLHQMAPASAAYNVSFAVRVVSEIDPETLWEAFRVLTGRHSALRTAFETVEGRPVARVRSESTLDVQHIDATPWSQEELDARLVEWTHRPFDLRRAPLFRVRLFQRGARDHVLLLTAHHILVDFWSLMVLMGELPEVYASLKARQPVALATSASQPVDHANWQSALLEGPRGEELWRYWRKQLAGAPPVLSLPADRPRAPVQSDRGAVHVSRWDPRRVERLKAFATSRGATPYTLLLAAFQVLLYRYTGQEDIVVGSSVAGRTRAEFAGTVGYLVNQLGLRARLSHDLGFEQFLQQVRQTVLDALAHQEYPFALLVNRLRPGRDSSHSPLFQTMFLHEKPHRQQAISALVTREQDTSIQLGGLTLEPFALEHRAAQFDLTLKMTEGDDSLTASWEYNSDLFDAATIQRMNGHLQTLLDAILEQPGQTLGDLPLMSADEQRRLLIDWNDTRTSYPEDKCFHELFEAQAARTPDAIAVEYMDQRLDYRELNQRANRIAHQLIGLGIGPESLVGVCVHRSLELMVALLGVLKAGAAYVPLDPSYPAQRLAYVLEDAGVAALLTQRELLTKLPGRSVRTLCVDGDGDELVRNSPDNPRGRATPGSLAYIIYTSGSTGRPKGVMVQHRGLVNYLAWCEHAYAVDGGRGAPVVTSIGFDATITSLFTPLLAGKKVVLLPEQEELSALMNVLRAERDFSLVKLTPAHLDLLRNSMPAEQAAGGTRAFIVGGEALARESLAFWRTHAPETKIINEYGPTETVVGCCTHEVTSLAFASGNVPIGRPIANTQLYILDARLRPVPVGVSGELYIGGAGVARGYLHRPELTAERFICDPFSTEPGARLYKTGDLARYLADGKIEFLGRADDQVKIRGFRVELGEVEAALRLHPRVQDAAVVAQPEAGGGNRLVAYIVWKNPSGNTLPVEVRHFLAESLPHYMVPAAIVSLDKLPLTSHGKLDRTALPLPDNARPALEATYVRPSNDLEQLIAAVWQEVLQLDKVGVNDNFFDLGGHSLLAAQVRHKLEEQLKRDISLVQLLQYPTIRALAGFLARGHETSPETQGIQDRIKKQKQAHLAIRKKREHS
ncbi:Long-chain-fatty-acid--CoA ligase [Cystobacter fuscus DSM 2262]|uniref:Long-chain-fatty-acid--CoA ligase n=1 Tax=Cystobacter fuscus (strain ATCC 25194 / DSM 2262 / NBRC 100088 / M29) TaxID=1242864 RepID=S9P9T0_CYSF2|nr:non-ribosomal peptide synthetase [Cystobacter fuscus]EPX59032.1 Long-chain-fatty-acid--CoA ligase [Cystobacter fuscus DSM 2262]